MDETIVQPEGGCILFDLSKREASDSKMRAWRRWFSFLGKRIKIAKN